MKKRKQHGREYLEAPVTELLNLKLADVVEALVNSDSPVDVYEEILNVRVGDALDILLTYLDEDLAELVKENGSYIWDGDPDSGTTELLNSSFLLVISDLTSGGEKILDKDVDVYLDLAGDLINYVLGVAGLEEAVPEEVVDGAIDIFKAAVDCKLSEVKDAELTGFKLVLPLLS